MQRPLWTCPRCGKAYVTRNASHSCVVVPLEAHFVGGPRARELFDALHRALEADGPVTVSVSKTRIEFMTRARFLSLSVRRDSLRLGLWLKRPIESPRFVRVESYGLHDWVHRLDLRDEAEIDDELRGWLREGRTVGDQRAVMRTVTE